MLQHLATLYDVLLHFITLYPQDLIKKLSQ